MEEKTNQKLDELIEEIEQGKNLEGTHLVSHFKSLIGVYNTEKQDAEFLEEIAWYAYENGKIKVANALAEYVSNVYFKWNMKQANLRRGVCH